MDANDPYLVRLRRELTRAQAQLRRAERERDRLSAMNRQLLDLLGEHGIVPPEPTE